jgi:hypothetical protein
MILIGMPGIEKRLARYPQLYSRIGFVHEYRALSAAELTFVLQHHWAKLGLTLSASDFTDSASHAAHITPGDGTSSRTARNWPGVVATGQPASSITTSPAGSVA